MTCFQTTLCIEPVESNKYGYLSLSIKYKYKLFVRSSDSTNLTQAHRLPGWCVTTTRHRGWGVTRPYRHLGSAATSSACYQTATTTGHSNSTVLLPSVEKR